MARIIVLRFEAKCHDCGRSLSVGSQVRWFGKGRVSCCGSSPAAATPSAAPVAAPTAFPAPARLDVPPPGDSAAIYRAALDRVSSPQPGDKVASLPKLAADHPTQRVLVLLSSGGYFVAPAVHALQVVACIVESCRDRVLRIEVAP